MEPILFPILAMISFICKSSDILYSFNSLFFSFAQSFTLFKFLTHVSLSYCLGLGSGSLIPLGIFRLPPVCLGLLYLSPIILTLFVYFFTLLSDVGFFCSPLGVIASVAAVATATAISVWFSSSSVMP